MSDRPKWTVPGTPDWVAFWCEPSWEHVAHTPKRCAQRGMAYLMICYPDRLSNVDWSEVAISSTVDCPLGKLHGSYSASPEYQELWIDFLAAHGFTSNDDDPTPALEQLSALTVAWREVGSEMPR